MNNIFIDSGTYGIEFTETLTWTQCKLGISKTQNPILI